MRKLNHILRAAALAGLVAATACVHDARDIHAQRRTPARAPSALDAHSWPQCTLIGPSTRDPGVYGTDLGYTVLRPGQGPNPTLAVLFGDTWARPVDACQYSVLRSDDLQASLPATRPAVLHPGPPIGTEAAACNALHYELTDPKQPTSWPRARLFPNTVAESSDALMDLGALRTPVAAFSDGQHLFAIFYRDDPLRCAIASECPHGMTCSKDPSYAGNPIGTCGPSIPLSPDAPPTYCRDAADCGPGLDCQPADRGVCLSPRPFEAHTPGGQPLVPDWYREDPRRGIARTMYIAAAIWPERPTDYAVVARFATNRFTNVVARTIAHFDPSDPSKNDYRPGDHTLLLWGRSNFFEKGGAQALPFLLYIPLAELRTAPDHMQWRPQFFAGYDDAGRPSWSPHEHDALPIYNADPQLVHTAAGNQLRFGEPEFDYVNQMTVSYIAPLQRWVMFYGGNVPAFMLADARTGDTPEPAHLQPSAGAIHLRSAAHPWGRATRDRPTHEAWSSAEPLLTRTDAASYLACGTGGPAELHGCVKDADPDGPLDLLATLAGLPPDKFAKVAGPCLVGEVESEIQTELSGNPIGRMYAANIIDSWTADVSGETPGLPPTERAVDVYWNVSTWSPYQVVLVKSQLQGKPLQSVTSRPAGLR